MCTKCWRTSEFTEDIQKDILYFWKFLRDDFETNLIKKRKAEAEQQLIDEEADRNL
jgi:hypothetical protein